MVLKADTWTCHRCKYWCINVSSETEKKLRSLIDEWTSEDGMHEETLRKKVLIYVELVNRYKSLPTKDLFIELQRIFPDTKELAEVTMEGNKIIEIIADAFKPD